jgi:hypothetical protein
MNFLSPFRKSLRLLFAASTMVGAATVASIAAAQQATPRAAVPGTLIGVVLDSAGRPVENADVLVMQLQRRARSREDGTVRFDSVPGGKYTLQVRHIGYKELSSKITVKESGAVVELRLVRTPFFLPSVLTMANRGGLSGVIADTAYQPLAGVKINVIGGGQGAESDSTGAFYVPVKPGHYFVELKRNGYARQMVGVTVPPDSGRKLAAWMVPQSGGADPQYGAMLFDLPIRINRANAVWDRFYTREDLERVNITDVRQLAMAETMKFMPPDCPVQIDGDPKRWVPLWSLRTEDVEFVEVHLAPNRPPTGGPKEGGSRDKLAAQKVAMNGLPTSDCGTVVIAWLRK